ncbi:hypothetical protein RJ639_010352 [Escallonia herrerae]|uniref:F-box domain-containing protein n=1 Tax=Escallonia herrerae TaxID=1293975 RepID=A0AA88VPU2_9ASTE|nr:hypothetical protein RJ639_010352 [Escallonia herrerae]
MELPLDVWAKILSKLGAVDVLESAQKVCTTWRKICKDPAMWKVIDMHNLGDLPYDLEVMARHAVDRSQGQLVDINIEYCGSDELLEYIVDRVLDSSGADILSVSQGQVVDVNIEYFGSDELLEYIVDRYNASLYF